MSREAVETLMDKWTNEPAFRAEMRADPQAAVKKAGVALSDDEWAALRTIDWKLSDEQLRSRISHFA